jgi:hypothetical protein
MTAFCKRCWGMLLQYTGLIVTSQSHGNANGMFNVITFVIFELTITIILV